MLQKLLLTIFIAASQLAFTENVANYDSVANPIRIIDLDVTLDSLIKKPQTIQEVTAIMRDSIRTDSTINNNNYIIDTKNVRKIMANLPIINFAPTNNISQNLLLPLVTYYEHSNLDFKKHLTKKNLFDGKKAYNFWQYENETTEKLNNPDLLKEMQKKAFNFILTTNPTLIAYHQDDLPTTDDVKSRMIEYDYKEKIKLFSDEELSVRAKRKLVVEKVELGPWTSKANTYLQFSQNYVSKNWHQGGSSSVAILGTLTAKFNYDNKKNIQWENSGEWRAGFQSIEGDKKNRLNTNDDILKLYSKLGVKAGGDFFYSAAFDFSMPLFRTYKSVTSDDLKADFMTPVRTNFSVGMDYKYKKFLSVMVSPVSFKYIYLNNKDIDSKLFGIQPGEHILSEIGSSIKVQANYAPTKEMTFESRLSFYTNYDKVEFDWEIKGNFQINRFLSTRIMLNPRYDNSVIESGSDKAKIQFKQLLTFGLAYRILN